MSKTKTAVKKVAKKTTKVAKSESAMPADLKAWATENELRTPNITMDKEESTRSYIHRLIEAGFTNQEIWLACHKQAGLAWEHRSYPSWYRSQLKKVEAK